MESVEDEARSLHQSDAVDGARPDSGRAPATGEGTGQAAEPCPECVARTAGGAAWA